jgi:hypothetical protein
MLFMVRTGLDAADEWYDRVRSGLAVGVTCLRALLRELIPTVGDPVRHSETFDVPAELLSFRLLSILESTARIYSALLRVILRDARVTVWHSRHQTSSLKERRAARKGDIQCHMLRSERKIQVTSSFGTKIMAPVNQLS